MDVKDSSESVVQTVVARLSRQGKASTGFATEKYAYPASARVIKALHRSEWSACAVLVLHWTPRRWRASSRSVRGCAGWRTRVWVKY
jgi:hypothetical protein